MKTSVTLILVCCAALIRAQAALSYFPFQSLLCLSSNTEKLLWAELKVETNTFFTNMNMELSPKIHLKRTEAANYYLGAGTSFNPVYAAADLSPLNGYFIDLGVRVKPLKQHRNLQVVFELSPYVNAYLAGGNLRTRLGITYNFSRKSTTQN